MAPKANFKQEPELTEAPSDPVEVPPSIVLEKLQTLLDGGHAMLTYQPHSLLGTVWGINGKLENQWCSFRMKDDGVCEFVDDEIWHTGPKDEWAESELEEVAAFKAKALSHATTTQAQPFGWQPRACRRAVFNFHRGRYKAARAAKKGGAPATAPPVVMKARAKPAASKPDEAAMPEIIDSDSGEEAEAAAPAEEEEEEEDAEEPTPATKAPASKAPLSKAPMSKAPMSKAPMTKAPTAKAPAAKAPVAKPPVPKAAEAPGKPGKPPTGVNKVSFQQFLAKAKTEMATKDKKSYVQMLKAIQEAKNGPSAPVEALLKGFPSLLAMYREIRSASSAAKTQPKQPKQPGAPPPSHLTIKAKVDIPKSSAPAKPKAKDAATLAAEAAAAAAAAVVKQNAEIERLKEKLLKSLDSVSLKPARLLKLVCGQRAVPATRRLGMLRYLQSRCSEGKTGEMVFLRGPSSSGKSTYALDQLKVQACLVDEEEAAAQLLHICSDDDFAISCKGVTEIYTEPEADKVKESFAKNRARVQLAMELGVEPLYIDNPNLQLHEMQAYVKLAESAGYTVRVVSPDEFNPDWTNVGALLSRDKARGQRSKATTKEQLQKEVKSFQPLPEDCFDPIPAILGAKAVPSAPAVVAEPADEDWEGSAAPSAAATGAAKRPAPPAQAPPAKVAKAAAPAKVAKAAAPAKVAKAAPPSAKGTPAKRPAPAASPEPEDDDEVIIEDDEFPADEEPAPKAAPAEEEDDGGWMSLLGGADDDDDGALPAEQSLASNLLANLRKKAKT